MTIPSVHYLDFDSLKPGTKGVIMSGIAIPDWHINDDGHTYQRQYTIDLGYPAVSITNATATAGLASIYNGGSAFLFAVNDYTIGIDPNSQNMTLTLDLACMGAPSNLSRIGYQVVAVVVVPETGISGTITFPQGLFGAAPNTPAGLKSLFAISADSYDSDPGGGGFGSGAPTPHAYGAITSVTTIGNNVVASYNIPAAPFNMKLKVIVTMTPDHPAYTGFGRSAGPDPITLTLQYPNANGVDFAYYSNPVR